MLALVTLIACHSETTDPAGSDGASADIVAAEGGTLALGDATLEVPPGALAEDTTLTVDLVDAGGLADAGSVVGMAFDYGPDGLQFLTPATLVVSADAPAEGQALVLSWYDEGAGAWVDLPTTFDGGEATAPVEHFTTFALRSVEAGAADPCIPVSPCGGDPTGSWTLVAGCVVDDLDMEECPDATIDFTLETEGTYDFLAGGAFSYDVTITVGSTMTLPAECLPGGLDCSLIDAGCTGTTDTGCVCTSTEDPDHASGSGTWSVSGTDLVVDDGSGPSTQPFCIGGDTMTVLDPDGGAQLVFTR
ncbi:MAG: hypothetical protein H6735_31375 [Alphaproteobacteria bacterium]|nr:hypothetical protein [Alphaproteobacteria bacterium]